MDWGQIPDGTMAADFCVLYYTKMLAGIINIIYKLAYRQKSSIPRKTAGYDPTTQCGTGKPAPPQTSSSLTRSVFVARIHATNG